MWPLQENRFWANTTIASVTWCSRHRSATKQRGESKFGIHQMGSHSCLCSQFVQRIWSICSMTSSSGGDSKRISGRFAMTWSACWRSMDGLRIHFRTATACKMATTGVIKNGCHDVGTTSGLSPGHHLSRNCLQGMLRGDQSQQLHQTMWCWCNKTGHVETECQGNASGESSVLACSPRKWRTRCCQQLTYLWMEEDVQHE